MKDACRHCQVRGKVEVCLKQECIIHGSWLVSELRAQLVAVGEALNYTPGNDIVECAKDAGNALQAVGRATGVDWDYYTELPKIVQDIKAQLAELTAHWDRRLCDCIDERNAAKAQLAECQRERDAWKEKHALPGESKKWSLISNYELDKLYAERDAALAQLAECQEELTAFRHLHDDRTAERNTALAQLAEAQEVIKSTNPMGDLLQVVLERDAAAERCKRMEGALDIIEQMAVDGPDNPGGPYKMLAEIEDKARAALAEKGGE